MNVTQTDVVVILGSGPNAPQARSWDRSWFDRLVVINNAWRVRSDWDDLIFPEDFPPERRPHGVNPHQRLIEADQFVPAQNAYGGFVYAGGTMAFTAAYWALHAHRPRVLGFLGCDMVYPKTGATHFYGSGTADPLREDVTLRDLGAKSARLGALAQQQGCACVNLSDAPETALLFERCAPRDLRAWSSPEPPLSTADLAGVLAQEKHLGYMVPSGRYWEEAARFDVQAIDALDARWRALWEPRLP